MGAWGPGLFENDSALDFMDVLPRRGWAYVRKHLNIVSYDEALVSAELLTHALGHGKYDNGRVLAAWLQKHPNPSLAEDVARARHVLEQMEAVDYGWPQNSDAKAHLRLIRDIRKRLEATPRERASKRTLRGGRPRR